jgi:hypothetical protein
MSGLRIHSILMVSLGIALSLMSSPAAAQDNPRDFSGLWEGGPGSDISDDLLPGEEVSLTPYGAQRYRALDQAKSPANTCLPYGPTRALQSEDPKFIVHTPHAMAILIEQTTNWRLIHTDGRPHPPDAATKLLWDGHSIGRWEGNTLIVDSVGFVDRTWLDSGGFEHSDKLHLIERFEKINPNTLRWTVTVEDPVFYTKTFTYRRDLRRANPAETPRILPQICHENELDSEHMMTMTPNRHAVPPKFPN